MLRNKKDIGTKSETRTQRRHVNWPHGHQAGNGRHRLATKKKGSKTLWGLATSIDIYNCRPSTIRNAEHIRSFVVALCDLIEMRRFGDPVIVHFGEDEKVAGYSMTQLIETSLVSAHFANLTNTVYLDVFSCKPYDPTKVANFSRNWFGGARTIIHVTPRI